MNSKLELIDCVRNLYSLGLNTAISGNHSIRNGNSWMWITPTGIPRYKLKTGDLVKVNLKTRKTIGRKQPSIEWEMHLNIYNSCNANAIVHCHSPYTLGICISSKFQHVIEEAKIVVGNPTIIGNYSSGSKELALNVARCFQNKNTKAVIIKNHGIVTTGKDIHEARAIVESLEEWAKILTVSKIFGGPRDIL
jgi:L-fuculose-phosphate aldolase